MTRGSRWPVSVAGVVAGLAVATALSASAAPPQTAAKIKPDLHVASMTAEQAAVQPDGTVQVKVTVRIGLRAAGDVATGPFKVRLEYRDALPLAGMRRDKRLGGYTYLQEAGVAGMTSSASSSRVPGETRLFTDTVPGGANRTYRATVDALDQVDESDEANNTATASFSAGCAGVDLVVTRVVLRRSARGTVGKVWVKNRCLATCDGVVQWSVFREPLPDYPVYTDVGQVITRRLAGGEVAESPNYMNLSDGDVVIDPTAVLPPESGAVAAPRDETWRVSVLRGSGGCTEADTSNNSCRATLRAGQESSVTECR